MNLENFIKGFADQFDDTDESEINASTNFHELEEWSSLISMSLIAFVRTEYGKKLTGNDIRECETVEDLFNLIASKQ
jgi:acyl carrier protein